MIERNWLPKAKKQLRGASASLSVQIPWTVWYPVQHHVLMNSLKPGECVAVCMQAEILDLFQLLADRHHCCFKDAWLCESLCSRLRPVCEGGQSSALWPKPLYVLIQVILKGWHVVITFWSYQACLDVSFARGTISMSADNGALAHTARLLWCA